MEKQQITPGSFEEAYASSILAVDTLNGADVSSPKEEDHFIADYWAATETDYPESFRHPDAVAIRTMIQNGQGETPEAKALMAKYIREQKLLDLPAEAVRLSADFDEGRQTFIRHTMATIGLMLKMAHSNATDGETPEYEELYRSVTGEEPKLVPHKEKQEALRAALAGVGIEGRDLVEMTREWEGRNEIPADQFAGRAKAVSTDLRELSRERLLRKIDFPVAGDPHLEGFAFDGIQLRTVQNVAYTGSNVYRGGLGSDGKLLLEAVNTYNTDHTLREEDLRALYGHESFPGHYLRAATDDIIRRLAHPDEFERTIGTMCTSSVAMEEGWAQVSLPMLYGGTRQDVIDALGPDYAVHYALEDLQDAGKHNGSIIHLLHRKPLDEAKRHFSEDLVLKPSIVNKLSRAWTTSLLMGSTYGPSYEKGRTALTAAIQKYGVLEVARVAMQIDAPVELRGFKEKMGV
jgi:hypothetical protein